MADGDSTNGTDNKRKCDDDGSGVISKKIRSIDAMFEGFSVKKVLNENSQKKLIIVQGMTICSSSKLITL